MSLKINNNNISKMKINGFYIKLAKINSDIVFQNEVSMTLSNKIITVFGTGNYDIYYASDNGIIESYDKICTLKNNSYNHLNELNIAPSDATRIVACEMNTTNILASVNLTDELKDDTSTKLYSVGLLSDIHIDNDGTDESFSQSDFQNALTFFRENAIDFVGIAGDITNSYGDGTDYSAYNSIVNQNSDITIKVCAGNHDVGVDYQSYLGIEQNYVVTYNEDIYIFLSLNAWDNDNPLSSSQITWLTNTLNTYKNNKVFLFFHFYIDPVGNVNSIYQNTLCISNEEGTTGYDFRNLLSIYKDNVVMLSGHSHLDFELQELSSDANVRNKTDECCILVHIPSCARPRNENRNDVNNGSQGYIMEVYQDKIVLKGINFIKNKFLPIATYKIPFKIITSEVSETNLLKLLEENSSWSSYNGTEASAIFNNDNTITINADGSSSWGLNISQPNLTLSAGKTYKFSCSNIASSTWISLNNENSMQLNSGKSSVEFTPSEDIVSPQIVIWVSSGVVYDNVIWDIKLEEI